MSNGVKILDTITKHCVVKKLGPKKFKIILLKDSTVRLGECVNPWAIK